MKRIECYSFKINYEYKLVFQKFKNSYNSRELNVIQDIF